MAGRETPATVAVVRVTAEATQTIWSCRNHSLRALAEFEPGGDISVVATDLPGKGCKGCQEDW